MRASVTLAAAAALLSKSAFALDNGLARTPQMGYNSWYDVLMGPSETMVRETAQAMISNGV
jgi:alpha-galactosidase